MKEYFYKAFEIALGSSNNLEQVFKKVSLTDFLRSEQSEDVMS